MKSYAVIIVAISADDYGPLRCTGINCGPLQSATRKSEIDA
jgi:hypothetical protein